MSRSQRLKTAAATLAIAGPALWSEAADAQDVTLRMTIWSANEAHLDLFNGIAEDFQAMHPDVAVTFDSLPFENYTTTLTTQIAGGNAPDLAWIFETTALDFVDSGALYPLRETFEATEGYSLEEVAEGPLGLWTRDGEIYAYPFSTSPFGIFVNEDLVGEAGQRTPADLIEAGEWTWENAIAVASAVNAETGKAGLVVRDFDYRMWDNLATIWDGWGASPWSEDGGTCTFDAPEMVAAMTFIHDAIFEQNAMPGPGTAADFFSGDAGMTVTQISRASLLPEDGFAWDLVPLPAGPAGEYAVIGQAAIGVFQASENAELAAEFLAFLSNPENSARLAQFFPSARESLLNAETLAGTNPRLTPEQLNDVVVEGIANGRVKPSHAGFAQIQQMVRAGLDPLWNEGADVEAGLAAICDRIVPLLAR